VVVGRTCKKYCSKNCKSSEKIYKRSDRDRKEENDFISKIEINKNDGGFLNESIEINISYRNVTHYLKLGYNAIINNKLKINVLDLPSVSHVRVDPICEVCGSVVNIQFNKYISNKKRDGIYTCKKCKVGKCSIVDVEKSEDRYTEINRISFRIYKNEVRRLTRKSSKVLYENWDGKDYYDGEYIKCYINDSPISNGYPTIDHKRSVYYGFKNNIPASEIADISNLCITKRCINSAKRDMIDFEI